MWTEIFVDDLEALQRHVDHYNTMACNISANNTIDLDLLKRILNTKTECHAYYYEDSDRQIIVMYKYDISEDVMVIFQIFDNASIKDAVHLKDKTWDINTEMIRIILRHNKKVRWRKYPDTIRDSSEYKQIISNPQALADGWAERGIKATESERYWEYELM